MELNHHIQCLFILTIFAPSLQACPMTVKGGSWEFDYDRDTIVPGVKTLQKCSELCLVDNTCLGYTLAKDSNKIISYCYLFKGYFFKDLGEMQACDNCESGTVPTYLDAGQSCSADPDDVLAEESTSTPEQCWDLCSKTLHCSAFNWFNATSFLPNYCFLYSQCSGQRSCDSCVSGRINCIQAPQCFEYSVMDEETRNANIRVDTDKKLSLFCDQTGLEFSSTRWLGPGYYRMLPPAGLYVPEYNPGRHSCGTSVTFWLNGKHPEEMFVETEVEFCGDAVASGNCNERVKGTVTKCNGYFVYYLPDTPFEYRRYCAAMQTKY